MSGEKLMFKFTRLKNLHEDMILKGEKRAVFPFSFNKKGFSCIFLTDVKPMRLYLSTLGCFPYVFEFEINDDYYTKDYIDNYRELLEYLELKYSPDHIFRPCDFLTELNKQIPQTFPSKIRYSDVIGIVSRKRVVEEPNKKYFCGWKTNSNGATVTHPNLEKTRAAFGDRLAKISLEKNISSKWTDIEDKERIKKINDLYTM